MKTTRPNRPEHRTGAAALALCALLAAACSTTTPAPKRVGAAETAVPSYTFTIQFTTVQTASGAKLCPTDASMEETKRNCDLAKKDCVKANRGEQVVFDGVAPAGESTPQFAIHFDPFKGAPLPMNGSRATLNIDPEAPLQTYYFYVTSSPGCPVLDPVIIVTH